MLNFELKISRYKFGGPMSLTSIQNGTSMDLRRSKITIRLKWSLNKTEIVSNDSNQKLIRTMDNRTEPKNCNSTILFGSFCDTKLFDLVRGSTVHFESMS